MNCTDIIELFNVLSNKENNKKTFISLLENKITYHDFWVDLQKINSHLSSFNLGIGDKLVISTSDDYAKILFFMFSLRNGLIPILLHENINTKRAQHILAEIQPCILLLDERNILKWNIKKSDFKLVVPVVSKSTGNRLKNLLKKKKESSVLSFPALLNGANTNDEFVGNINPGDIAYILYTSGTTANPKGVVITHENLFTHLATLTKVYGLNSDSRLLNILQLEHADGMIQGPILAAYNQAMVIRPMPFEVSLIPNLLASIYKYEITHFFAVPAMLALIQKFGQEEYHDSFDGKHFKMIISVSSHIEESLWSAFQTTYNVKIVNVYGLTETVAGSFYCGPSDTNFQLGTIGMPVDAEVKIIDDNLEEVASMTEGELLIKGKHIFKGYYNNEIETNKTLKDGWLFTGDIAIVTKEGFYKIVGRKKNILISGGFNIFPEEVTEILLQHPSVENCYCLALKDDVFGEKLVAAIIPRTTNLDTASLDAFAHQNLESYKTPKEYIFMDSFPMGISGKVDVPEIRRKISKKEIVEIQIDDIEKGVLKVASQAFNVAVSDLTIAHNSRNLEGWDSMAHLHFITSLETAFNLRFSTSNIMTMNSIQSAIKVITNERK